LARKVRRYHPATIAFLGLGAYRHAFDSPDAVIGPQPRAFEGARVWVLPSPSGLNANHQLPELTKLFRDLRKSARR
jgi:TDG/mug DNA glycosylase family protein